MHCLERKLFFSPRDRPQPIVFRAPSRSDRPQSSGSLGAPLGEDISFLGFSLHLGYCKKGKLKKGDCYIINQSASNHSGSHFVAVFITSKTTAEYFDSYAIPFSIDKNLVEAFDIGKLDIQQFEKTIQSPKSQFCGIFCIAYLLSKQIDMKTEVFANLFAKENLLKNDKIALEIVKTFIQNLKY